MKFLNVAVLGAGLIGGSVVKSIAQKLPQVKVTAWDTDAATRGQLGAFAAPSLQAALKDADLVVLAVPLPALENLAKDMAPHLAAGAVVTDVASVKLPLVERVAPLLKPHALVPAHPIAGSERGGYGAADAELFTGRQIILTPPDPYAAAVQPVADFWRSLGARVDFMPPGLHDRIYAALSHLPQALSFIYSDVLDELKVPREGLDAQFLRLGASPRGLWDGIFAANAMPLRNAAQEFLNTLSQIIAELAEGAESAEAAPREALYGAWLPRILASCLVGVAATIEDELGIPVRGYAGRGFTDFTSVLATDPEMHLERISQHANELRYSLSIIHQYISNFIKTL